MANWFCIVSEVLEWFCLNLLAKKRVSRLQDARYPCNQVRKETKAEIYIYTWGRKKPVTHITLFLKRLQSLSNTCYTIDINPLGPIPSNFFSLKNDIKKNSASRIFCCTPNNFYYSPPSPYCGTNIIQPFYGSRRPRDWSWIG